MEARKEGDPIYGEEKGPQAGVWRLERGAGEEGRDRDREGTPTPLGGMPRSVVCPGYREPSLRHACVAIYNTASELYI
jgi:hypothetical protein